MNTTLTEAPNYQIDEKGTITNISKKNPVFPNVDGKVGLYVGEGANKKRIYLKVSELKERYCSEGGVKKADAKPEKEVKTAKAKTAKPKKEGKSGADIIREAYDKDPQNFDMKKFAEESGISYGRVYGCIQKHKRGEK